MSDEIPPQFSPDGHYWWNGSEWVPAEHLPTQAAIPVPRDPFAKRPRNWRPPLFIGLGALLALLVLAGAIFGVTRLVSSRAQVRPAATASAHPTRKPTAKPTPIPTPTPTPITASGTAIPGLSGTALLALGRQQGLACGGATGEGGAYRWRCTAVHGQMSYSLEFTGTDAEHVSAVLAAVQASPGAPEGAAVRDFLAAVGGVTYQGARQATARAWVSRNLAGGTEIFGPAIFHTQRQAAQLWLLQIYPHT
jgi:hypothetical protein